MARLAKASPEEMLNRFWRFTRVVGRCWEWQGQRSRGGYGQIYLSPSRANVRAHRFAYEQTWGDIPPGLVVMHSCDNRCCVNPAHLRTGTPGDNNRDCVAKNRDRPHNRFKTHCIHGHEFTSDNTAIQAGRRQCRACHRAKCARQRAARRQSPREQGQTDG